MALAAYDRAAVHTARMLMEEDPTAAITLLREGLDAPANLGEGRHPAHGMAERLVALGDALGLAGDKEAAREAWEQACQEGSSLAVDPAPAVPADYWRGIAHSRLERQEEADRIWRSLETRAGELESAPSTPDYFATSLPELLLFDTDTDSSRTDEAKSLHELAARGRAHQKEKATL